MIVEMEFLLGDDAIVREADLGPMLAKDPQSKPPVTDAMGALTYRDGAVAFKFVDVLSWVVTTLAFESLPALAKDGETQFNFWSEPFEIDLKRDGDELDISSENFAPVRFPMQGFSIATLEAVTRFLDLVDKHWPEDTVLDRASLREQAKAAQAALD